MIANRIHVAESGAAAAFAAVGRVARAVLCLAVAAVLVVTLRFGLYDYFHGGGRSLFAIVDAIRR
jgi:hypothetical protein